MYYCYYYTDLLLDKKPQLDDLLRLFKSSAHYKVIGIALSVPVGDLVPYPGATTNNLILVFERWMDSNKGVTWRTILQVCKDYPDHLGKAEADLKQFLSSPSAHSLYGASPDESNSIISSSTGAHFYYFKSVALASLILLFVAILISYLC